MRAILRVRRDFFMKIRDIMSTPAIRIHPEETVAVAARMLERSNIGALPVCGSDGRLCGLLTDRDIDPMSGGRAFAVRYTRKSRYDHGSSIRPTGYGFGTGSGAYGTQADQKTAGDGEWEAVRHAEPWRSGAAGRKQHRSGRRADRDQRSLVWPVLSTIHQGSTDVRKNSTQK